MNDEGALTYFSIGIGPSSSHTVGPMRAAGRFARWVARNCAPHRVTVELLGSLGATGRGHRTDLGVVLGLLGHSPESLDPDAATELFSAVATTGRLSLDSKVPIAFSPTDDIKYEPRRSGPHPNTAIFTAYDETESVVASRTYLSVGGGTVVEDPYPGSLLTSPPAGTVDALRFLSAEELLKRCTTNETTIADEQLAVEEAFRPAEDTRKELLRRWRVMESCIARGSTQPGVLPGKLAVPRRAAALREKMEPFDPSDHKAAMGWVAMWAMAVNEENAAGGRVVTAPTNGAAGILPAVINYGLRYEGMDDDAVVVFLLTAAAVVSLFKANASISGAELGCQGEVGSACSIAAAGLCAVLGGTPQQVESAAEIGLEHNLGLTCDPIGGLVQIPCIERNAVGATKAIAAARLALLGDGAHLVSLDAAIATLKSTGLDMSHKYKETSLGGLAVNVIEC